jgi:hypothetical protein
MISIMMMCTDEDEGIDDERIDEDVVLITFGTRMGYVDDVHDRVVASMSVKVMYDDD